MYVASEDKIEAIGRVLNDQTRPLKERFRALFTLRNLGGPVAVRCIEQCFSDPSALLKHELAYCLGQMQDVRAIPELKRILADRNQEPMVRHEAGWFLSCYGQSLRPVIETPVMIGNPKTFKCAVFSFHLYPEMRYGI
jgi:deoxyhypusine monooxygenase